MKESTSINEKANGLEKVNRFYPSGNVSMTFVGEASNGQRMVKERLYHFTLMERLVRRTKAFGGMEC